MEHAPYRADDVERTEPVDPEELAEEIRLHEAHQAHQESLSVPTLQRALKAALGDQVTIIAPTRLRMSRRH